MYQLLNPNGMLRCLPEIQEPPLHRPRGRCDDHPRRHDVGWGIALS